MSLKVNYCYPEWCLSCPAHLDSPNHIWKLVIMHLLETVVGWLSLSGRGVQYVLHAWVFKPS